MKSTFKEILLSPMLVLVLSALAVHSVYCVCDSNNTVDYVPIPPEDYDRNYSSITNVDKRPLGFYQSIWYHENAGHPNPCFKVTGATRRRIEIMFETVPPSRLCIRVQGSVICSGSGTGRLSRCLSSQGNEVEIEFSCDSQCGEYDVRFWYRFVLGDLPENDPEDHWCEGRDQDEYPGNLRQLPPNFPINFDITTPADNATYLSSSVLAFLVAMSLHILF